MMRVLFVWCVVRFIEVGEGGNRRNGWWSWSNGGRLPLSSFFCIQLLMVEIDELDACCYRAQGDLFRFILGRSLREGSMKKRKKEVVLRWSGMKENLA